MMLATRIIPTLLYRGAGLYKGKQFKSWRQVGVAMQAVKIYQTRSVDELIVLDISATPEGRGPDLEMVEQLAEECFMPITVGGGIKSVKDVRDLLNSGADKVAIGTAAFSDGGRELVQEIVDRFGSQCLVVAIDVKGGYVTRKCGTDILNMLPLHQALACDELKVGEILLTSIDREGTMIGYDLDLIREISSAVSIPVVANGGCGSPQHMYEAIQAGAHAVAAGAMFQFTDTTPKDCSNFLDKNGVETRQ